MVSLLRGTAEDDYGDTTDDRQALYQDIGATLIETAQVVQDPATQTPRVIRAITALVPQWLGALTTDQVQDQGTGDVFIVEDVITQPSLTGAPPDCKLILRRVTSGGP
jgi:hypothetical protein